jgi:hypothetical protein
MMGSRLDGVPLLVRFLDSKNLSEAARLAEWKWKCKFYVKGGIFYTRASYFKRAKA